MIKARTMPITRRARPPRGAGRRMVKPKGKATHGAKRKVTSGVDRLDDLLMGGYPLKSAILVHGPRFSGKETLQNVLITSGLIQGAPGIIILTENTSSTIRQKLKPIMPNFTIFEKRGLLKYVDAYSMSVNLKGTNPYAVYIDRSKSLTEISKGLSKTLESFSKKYFYYRINFNSVSPILRKSGLEKTVNFLQLFITKAKARNAVTIFDMSEGIHQPSEISAIADLMDGVIEFKTEGSNNYIKVKGLGEALSRDWIEIKHSERKFEVTGPFAVQKIR